MARYDQKSISDFMDEVRNDPDNQFDSVSFTTQLSDIAYQVSAINDGDDITEKLKTALNLTSGNVAIYKSGTFLINDTVTIPSNRKLLFGKNTILKLANQTNKVMFTNSDTVNGNVNIEIDGGTFDGNNANQTRNDGGGYIGTLLRFNNITGFALKNIKVRNPLSFGVQMGNIHNFLVEGITFDYTNLLANMDGVHLNGLCDNGVIRKLTGNTNDDLLALNADDGSQYQMTQGQIYNITVEHIYAPNGYRAVRILSGASPVHNITIRNVYGRYTYAGVLFSNYGQGVGDIYNIKLENINCNVGTIEAAIHIDSNVKSLTINGIQRRATFTTEFECLRLTSGKTINNLTMDNINIVDDTANGISLLSIYGTIENFNISNIVKNRTLASNGRLMNLDGGLIKKINISNCLFVNSVQLFRLVNNGEIYTVNIANCMVDGVTLNAIDVSGNITNINLLNSKFDNVSGNIINLTSISKPIAINTQNMLYSSLTGVILSKQAGQSVRLKSTDFGIDATILTPALYDMVIHNLSAKGKVGLAMYDGTKWISTIDGTTIA